MLVITAISGVKCKKDPSLSSVSAIKNSPLPYLALLPISFSSPPITKVGSRPLFSKVKDIIGVVVVFPCVPATAIVLLPSQRLASISPRERRVILFCLEASSSQLLGGIADE